MTISVDGVAVLAGEELALVRVGRFGGHWNVYAWYLEVWVCRWRAIFLHSVEPGWRHTLLDAKSCAKRWTQMSWLEIFHAYFVLLTLIVYVAMSRRFRLLLILKECVMEHLVINVDFAHFGLHSLSHFLFQCFGLVCLSRLLPQLTDTRLFNEIGQLEGYLVYTALILQISALLGPVAGNRHRISHLFAVK